MKKIKARREHVCDHCYREIKKGETYLKEREVNVYDDDFADIVVATDYRYHIKCNYKHEQRLKRLRKLYDYVCEFGQVKQWTKWINLSELKTSNLRFHLTDYFDVSNIRFKEGLIKYNTSEMVTDDPFPMYQDFEEEFEFRILKK